MIILVTNLITDMSLFVHDENTCPFHTVESSTNQSSCQSIYARYYTHGSIFLFFLLNVWNIPTESVKAVTTVG